MDLQGEKVGLYLSGAPVPIEDCNIYITQPKIRDVVVYGEDDFLVATNILAHPENLTKETRKGNPILDQYSDFQLLLVILQTEQSEIQHLIMPIFELLFPDYNIEITDTSINFNIEQDGYSVTIGMVNSFNVDKFSNMIDILFSPQSFASDKDPKYNPINEAASAIADKLKKGRDRARQIQSEKDGENIPQSLYARYASILSIGMGMDINIFFNYTPFQLYDSFNRYFAKIPCDIDTRLRTMPLMDMSKEEPPETWTRNLYKVID